MAYVVVLSTSQSCNAAGTKWSPPTNDTPIRAAHHAPKGGTRVCAVHQVKYISPLPTNEREQRERGKARKEKKSHTDGKSGASRRRKRGRELAEPHFVSLDLVSVLSDTVRTEQSDTE